MARGGAGREPVQGGASAGAGRGERQGGARRTSGRSGASVSAGGEGEGSPWRKSPAVPASPHQGSPLRAPPPLHLPQPCPRPPRVGGPGGPDTWGDQGPKQNRRSRRGWGWACGGAEAAHRGWGNPVLRAPRWLPSARPWRRAASFPAPEPAWSLPPLGPGLKVRQRLGPASRPGGSPAPRPPNRP